MRKLISVPLLLLAGVFGLSSLANATNDGHLDGVWLSARIKTTIPKAINFAGSGPFAMVNNAKVDTGNNKCFVQLTWAGLGTFRYDMAAFCLNGSGLWEREEYNGVLYELNDSKQSLGSDWSYIYFAQNGRKFADFPADFAYAGYEGTLILTPSFKKGALKSIKAVSNAGMIYSWDNFSGTGGTSKSAGAFQLKFVNTANVPSGAIECAESAQAPLCDIGVN